MRSDPGCTFLTSMCPDSEMHLPPPLSSICSAFPLIQVSEPRGSLFCLELHVEGTIARKFVNQFANELNAMCESIFSSVIIKFPCINSKWKIYSNPGDIFSL